MLCCAGKFSPPAKPCSAFGQSALTPAAAAQPSTPPPRSQGMEGISSGAPRLLQGFGAPAEAVRGELHITMLLSAGCAWLEQLTLLQRAAGTGGWCPARSSS